MLSKLQVGVEHERTLVFLFNSGKLAPLAGWAYINVPAHDVYMHTYTFPELQDLIQMSCYFLSFLRPSSNS